MGTECINYKTFIRLPLRFQLYRLPDITAIIFQTG